MKPSMGAVRFVSLVLWMAAGGCVVKERTVVHPPPHEEKHGEHHDDHDHHDDHHDHDHHDHDDHDKDHH